MEQILEVNLVLSWICEHMHKNLMKMYDRLPSEMKKYLPREKPRLINYLYLRKLRCISFQPVARRISRHFMEWFMHRVAEGVVTVKTF